uniref:Uncharacterized protein n=1 Tax=Romanomermis culicivorax TaxID=13658 RepID=A0A915HI95_ROMCU
MNQYTVFDFNTECCQTSDGGQPSTYWERVTEKVVDANTRRERTKTELQKKVINGYQGARTSCCSLFRDREVGITRVIPDVPLQKNARES